MSNKRIKFLYIIIFVAISLVISILSCTGRSPIVGPEPVDISLGSIRGDVIDVNIIAGEGELGQGNVDRIGDGNAKVASIESIALEEGTLLLSVPQQILFSTPQQINELKIDFEMWIDVGEVAHENDPSLIAIGNPDLTWSATTKKITQTIFEFKEIKNFEPPSNNVLDPIVTGNYTAFMRFTLKDNNGLVNADAFLALKDLLLNITGSGFPEDIPPLIGPVPANNPPKIIGFEATPDTIATGGTSTLRWWVTDNPTSLTLSNNMDGKIQDVTNLVKLDVNPIQTTTYTLKATNARGNVEVQTTVTVVVDIQSVAINQVAPIVAVDGTTKLRTTVKDTNSNTLKGADAKVTWASSDNAVVRVNANGRVTGVSLGTTTITATSKVDNSKSATTNVTVTVAIQSVAIDQAAPTVAVGETTRLTTTVKDINGNTLTGTDAEINWASLNTAIATVNVNGRVTGISSGTAAITATSKVDNSKSATTNATVTVAIQSVTIDQATPTVAVGGTTNLTATVKDTNDNTLTGPDAEVTWASLDAAIATINANGQVTGVSSGIATIAATSKVDNSKSTITAVTVTNGANNPPVANAGSDQTVTVGSTVNLNGGESRDPDGDLLTFDWSLDPPTGSNAKLSSTNIANPTFLADVVGEFEVMLTVSDGTLTDSDTVVITTTNSLVECSGSYVVDGIDTEADLVDIRNCNIIKGDLTVNSSPLFEFKHDKLMRIEGTFSITNNNALTNINLANLTDVGSVLSIQNNNALTSIDLTNLTSVGSRLAINGAALTNLDLTNLNSVVGILINDTALTSIDLTNLTSVGSELSIRRNTALTNLDLTNLSSVGRVLTIENTALTNVNLTNLTSIGEDLDIVNNNVLVNIDLSMVASIGRDLFIDNNSALTSINFTRLTNVANDLSILRNNVLTNINLSSLTNVGATLNISINSALVTLDLTSLTDVGDSFTIRSTVLTNLSLANLTNVGNTLNISSNNVLADLDLSKLASVTQNLFIDGNGNNALKSINLSSLTNVGSDLRILSNNVLTSLGLTSLTDVGNNFTIRSTGLTNLLLPNLDAVGKSLFIDINDDLTNIELARLTSVGENLSIDRNSALTTINLTRLGSVATSLLIAGNSTLTSIDFDSLINVGTNVSINDNAALTSIDFANLPSIGGRLFIDNNTTLASFDITDLVSIGTDLLIQDSALINISLTSLTTIGNDLDISSNSVLTDIDLPNLTSVVSSLLIMNNVALTNLDLTNLTNVGSSLFVRDSVLTSLNLTNLTDVGVDFDIVSNSVLTSLDLSKLANVGADLFIFGNGTLASLDFTNLINVGKILRIDSNNSLTSLDLSKLTDVVSDLSISNNSALTSFDLTSLISMANDLTIDSNTALTDLDGLLNLATVGGTSTISDNTSLDCSPYNTDPFPLAFFPLDFSTGNLVDCTTN